MCWPKGKAERRYAGVTHLDVADFGQRQADEVRKMLDNAGVSISGLGYYPNSLSPDAAEAKAVLAHFKKVIQAAALLGVKLVKTFIGRDWTKSVDENWPRFLEVWKPLVQFAEDHGVRIGIENCPMLFTNDEWPGGKNLATSPTIWRRMFADIPSALLRPQLRPVAPGLAADGLRQAAAGVQDRIFHVHAKDVRLDRERLDDVGILATPLQYPHAQAARARRDRLGPVLLGAGRHRLRRPGLHRGRGSGVRRLAGDAQGRAAAECAIPASVHAIDRSIRWTTRTTTSPR